MNGVKNTVILVLSVIVLIQSAFLIYFMHRAAGKAKTSEQPAVSVAPRFLAKPEAVTRQAAAPLAVPAPVSEKPKVLPTRTLGRIILVLDDWGYNLKNKGFIMDNNFHVTLSILPGKPYSAMVAQFAFEKNKDVIVHMPMEPHDKNQYGLEENTLLVGMDKRKVNTLLAGALATVPHAKGLSNHMGSLATEDTPLMKIVMEYLKKNDLIFFDSLVSSMSVGRAVARKYGVRFASRDVFIDNLDDPAYIRQQLLKLAERAKQTGLAFGIGHDRLRTIAVLQEMIPRLEEEGYRFVNLSDAVGS
jgi:uncharacterized protein